VTTSLVLVVLGIALVDSINPSALAMTSYLLVRPDPWRIVAAYIAGIFVLYLGAGLVVVFVFGRTIDRIIDQLSSPTISYVIEAVVGIVALVFALRRPRAERRAGPSAPAGLTPRRAFVLGLTITAIEATTALPYLGALGAISRAGVPPPATVVLLVAYNLVFIAPPTVLTLIVRHSGSGLVERLSTRRGRGPGIGRTVLRVACGVLGVVLLLDAGAFFVAGEALLPG
jgi:cytochrome c biogenesis protein CcdA